MILPQTNEMAEIVLMFSGLSYNGNVIVMVR